LLGLEAAERERRWRPLREKEGDFYCFFAFSRESGQHVPKVANAGGKVGGSCVGLLASEFRTETLALKTDNPREDNVQEDLACLLRSPRAAETCIRDQMTKPLSLPLGPRSERALRLRVSL
jgi:hypothetical protein